MDNSYARKGMTITDETYQLAGERVEDGVEPGLIGNQAYDHLITIIEKSMINAMARALQTYG